TTHPDFAKNHFLYVYYTYKEGDKLWNKVLRVTESDDKIVDAKVILDKIPGAEFDDGGVIKFGDDGSIPSDNPNPNSPVYSFGHRNPQGLAWDYRGNLYETEEGPTKNDEINIIKKDNNYGWPNQECSGSTEYQSALNCYNISIEPAGIAYYGSSGKLDFKNSLILATLRGNILYQIPIANGNVTSQKIILDGLGRIREVGVGPDDYLYILTGNTDGQGFPDKTDDK